MAKAKISEFLMWAGDRAGVDKGKTQIGYVMGSLGENATDAWLQKIARSVYGSAWQKHYNNTKKWAGHIVTDCNGLAEAFLNMKLPGNHNTKAKYNYVTWCAGHNGRDMGKMPQVPGTAVFCADALGTIYHVAYLFYKYGPGPKQWYLLNNGSETKGLVLTKLEADKSFNRWGQMRLYFDYDMPAVEVKPPEPLYFTTTRELYLLGAIGRKYGVPWTSIRKADGSRPNPFAMRIGMKLRIK